jgi:CheY-like chemotaxis protein
MPNSTVNLLVVEDEAALRTSLAHIFAAFGHRVRCAADGFSALSELRLEIPDIILSDLNMPGMSGFEFLSVVRRRFPAIKVVAMSSAFPVDGVPLGVAADAFYQKGSNLGSLLQIVESMTTRGPQSPKLSSTPAPIWVERSEQNASDEACITLTCPECLRAFAQFCGEPQRPVHETNCTYCNNMFHYAIVQPDDPTRRGVRSQKPLIPLPVLPEHAQKNLA